MPLGALGAWGSIRSVGMMATGSCSNGWSCSSGVIAHAAVIACKTMHDHQCEKALVLCKELTFVIIYYYQLQHIIRNYPIIDIVILM